MSNEKLEKQKIIDQLEVVMLYALRQNDGEMSRYALPIILDLVHYADTDEQREKVLSWIRKLVIPAELEKLKVLL